MPDSQAGGRSDHDELVEVIKAFLDKYNGRANGAGKTRMQKFVYFGDLHSLQKYGYRLTNADFIPYHHGSYAEEISDILETADGIEAFESPYSDSPQYRNTEPPRLADDKLQIIDEVFDVVVNMSNDELEQASKGSWLYEETEFGTEMDFDEYSGDILPSPTQWRTLSLEDRTPAEEDADSIEGIVE